MTFDQTGCSDQKPGSRMYLLGVRIDNLSMQEVLEKIRGFLNDGRQHYIVTPNPEILILAQKDKEFREILNNADLSIADGVGLVRASRMLGEPLKERVTGVDLIPGIMNYESGIRNKVFLLGGRNGVAEKIAAQWPAVVGFSEETDGMELFARIRQCQPDILLVALGAPRQEKWIAENLAKVPSVKVAIGVGGAFDFLSGKIRRAPVFMQKMGLEWFWRLILQPWRVGRIFNAVIIFPSMILREKIKASK
ncbi:MAG: glycosyltransferase [Candidatus Portnoybacteria bacterium CG11_big_fil_rev_8_21_14_0_20_40_15]|uniref:Glycosyltransferase n=1 Tax=Candidatus Portnoybacteria bacterium CG11_big_fil_rev_8_21_14_0_20_40_15 TaxID=1974817 RepID=A0A2H0KT07_9BACT|nr:MAG: glycosyltransferase [Candidatus Portnoybacteria bacterium CG11_big_fil_rev_8_21_14_0_20_40_15]